MAETTKRRVGELVRGVFKILLGSPDGIPARQLLQTLEGVVPPTDFERSDYPEDPGVRRFEYIVRFATIAPVKAGWLVKNKGRWYITEEGKKAYNQIQDPEKFAQEASRLYNQWRASQPEALPREDPEGPRPAGSASEPDAPSGLEKAEEIAWAEIERYVQAMNPYDLQKLVAALLRAMGYHISWIAPPGPDKGTDIVAHNDPLGTSTPRIKVQVKRRADKITVDGLRSFMATLGDQDVGIFVSTGGFTNDAQSEARTKETRKLTLMDLERLVDLWIEHYEEVSDSDKSLLPLKPVHYLAPLE
jgi:restriction system protein